MKVRIGCGRAVGRVKAPPSKSMAHRLLIAAALADGESVIEGVSSCEDVLATLDCLRALGVRATVEGDGVRIRGTDMRSARASGVLPCRESGSTLRFILPLALLSGNPADFVGAARLFERPMSVYADICRERGLYYEASATGISVSGPIECGEYRVAGNISSQFITGLLFALSCLDGDSRIVITTELESTSYIGLTLSAMESFGVRAEWVDERTLYIKGGQRYRAGRIAVEGDYSGAAFPEALGALGGEVEVTGLSEESLQGDRVYRELFSRLAGGYAEIDIGDCPDLGPILFTLAAAMHGARFTGTARLRIKESDRAAVMAEELAKFGAVLTVSDNSVEVADLPLHAPEAVLCGHNDHRVVMSLAVLATRYGGELDGAEAISKSYPEFFRDLGMLGIPLEVIEK